MTHIVLIFTKLKQTVLILADYVVFLSEYFLVPYGLGTAGWFCLCF